MTNRGGVHVICILPLFFYEKRKYSFIYETKNTEKC